MGQLVDFLLYKNSALDWVYGGGGGGLAPKPYGFLHLCMIVKIIFSCYTIFYPLHVTIIMLNMLYSL